MASGHPSPDVSIEMEPPAGSPRVGRGTMGIIPSMTDVHRAHSRSASWSLPGGRTSLSTGMGLASLNPIAPITNVIREIVPSFDRLSRHSDSESSHRASREHSQNSLLLEETTEESGLNEMERPEGGASETEGGLGSHGDHMSIPMGGHNQPEEQNVGLELSDSVRWLEQNAVFLILLLIKFAWYHRSGMWVGHVGGG